MQYYLDGFRGGDPDLADAAPCRREYGPLAPLPDKVDVLIAGCGPAGLCLAAQLSRFPEIDVMIVEPKPGPMEKGQADGVNTRTMEIFQAFGFAEQVKRESYWVNQTAFWTPDPETPGHIRRIGRVQDVADDSSEMPHTLINQARIHELFLDVMHKSPRRIEPDYGWAVQDLVIDATTDDHPVTVTLENTGVNAGTTRTVRANYVVGCDGARSKVRRAIGGELHGDAAHQAWGVMDILANTDFPDVRQKCIVASATAGNILILPREGGYLFRMYVELDKLNPDERVASRNLTSGHMIAAANRIMRPYTIDVKEVVWWSVYEIGHRLTDRFDDVPEAGKQTRDPRVFTAGDACHTHSPKAGQGMNVSMQDSFNLGWKLAHVFQGRAAPSILRSYSAERRTEAKRLIDTDHAWARIMSAPPGESELDGSDMPRRAEAVHREPRVHRRPRGEIRPLGAGGRAHTPGAGAWPRDRPPFPLGPGGPPRRCHAHAARPRRRGRRPLAHLRLRRPRRQLRPGLGDPRSGGLARDRPRVARAEIHPQGRGHRRPHRPAGHLPADLRRPRRRGDARPAAARKGQARPARPREGLLHRPQGRGRHLRDARHRPRARLHGGGPPGPVHRPGPAAGRPPRAVGVLRRHPAPGHVTHPRPRAHEPVS
ncbi:putative phenol 2-monooxygenase [Salipiger mucosus DSM 16094]|uniref:Putative phenol 2-monooxygenase n=1 Tax=Salipiger mucosus DSM 16094 TaxID=1123237 RepID=S9REZ7_9RHOB|nr:putative phenol 2-monooxygenase [Salipiger mucosus DSM 16094]